MEDIILKLSISLPVFLMAIVFHEAAHAYMALRFGDNTAQSMGRLTLNPVAHYDLVGTIIFPLVGILLGGSMFGWAKPVPVDSRRFKNVRAGIFWVSFAGPLANILLSVVSAFLFAFLQSKVQASFYFHDVFSQMLVQSVYINVILAVFNLIPFPPLDGSKMVSSFLDYETSRKYEELARFSFLFVIILWTTPVLQYLIGPAIYAGQTLMGLFYQMLILI